MKITMLGTGNATVTECYNTCFVLENEGRYLLVDGGGGNLLLQRFKACGLRWQDMRDIFVTHKHLDHLLGIFWIVRMVCQGYKRGQFDGEVNIYGHEEVIGMLREMSIQLLGKTGTEPLDERLHLITVEDGEEKTIIGQKFTFFDIQSTKAKQFGFSMEMENGERLTCCGDEPYKECEEVYAKKSKWLLHEAFCLYGQADIFKPYEKHHSTVKDACELAEQLQVENLVLYHTEDKNIEKRKELYGEEGRKYFHGNLWIPDDLESFEL